MSVPWHRRHGERSRASCSLSCARAGKAEGSSLLGWWRGVFAGQLCGESLAGQGAVRGKSSCGPKCPHLKAYPVAAACPVVIREKYGPWSVWGNSVGYFEGLGRKLVAAMGHGTGRGCILPALTPGPWSCRGMWLETCARDRRVPGQTQE